MKQNFLGLLSLMVLCNSNFAFSQVKNKAFPNVVLILTDDQGWGDFGFDGNDKIHTPTLDSLYNISSKFTNFYVSPLSATTRAGLLTGRDHLRTGALCVTRASENMDEDEQTIAEMFKANGYVTGCFGKWHNGAHYPQDPNGQGFDEFFGFCSGHYPNYFSRPLQHNQEFVNTKGYITDVLTDSAIKFIKQHKKGKPFFCYIPYNALHAPYQVPDKYYDKYAYLSKGPDDTAPAVYAMCESLDDNISRVLKSINDSQIADNTLIVFLTDNGPNNFRYNGGMSGRKGELLEGGIKVPCMMYWKGKLKSMKIEPTASYVDILPTIMDLCGIKDYALNDRPVDGISLKPLLVSSDKVKVDNLENRLKERYLFTHRSQSDYDLLPSDGLVFNDEYKWMIHNNKRFELFDKIKDHKEKNNLINQESDLAQKMSSIYYNWYNKASKEYLDHNKRITKVGLLKTDIVLPSHEAYINGKVKYNKNKYGWAGDWLTNIYQGDTVKWDIDVVRAGKYRVELQYTLTKEAPSFSIAIAAHKLNAQTPFVRLKPYKPTQIPSPDRVERVEAYEQTWNSVAIGDMIFQKGVSDISVITKSVNPFIEGLEIKGIVIKSIK